MDVDAALGRLLEQSTVTFQSSSYLAGQVRKRAASLDKERRAKRLPRHERKPELIPVLESEHGGGMTIAPWELLHVLGRATVLAGQGSSRALSQHWACLKYITTLQANSRGRLELSADGKDPRYHRKSVQVEDLGIAFALATALRIAQQRHPEYRFEVVDADVALEAGWALRGTEVRERDSTRLRPDYFLFGLKERSAARIITVECKGSHGRVAAQHEQLAKASAQVHAVVVGDRDKGAASPPGLLMATALAAKGGIEIRILDPEGGGELAIPDHRAPRLNGPIEQFNEVAAVPVAKPDGEWDSRPGFYIPPERSEWFSRVLARTAAAGLLAFAGDRGAARTLLTKRQQARLGSEYDHPGTSVRCDTGITLAGLPFVGTDHVFRFGSQRMEVFSGMLEQMHGLLRDSHDFQGYETALPHVLTAWGQRRDDAAAEWGGVIFMDTDGAIMGLRPMGAGRPLR